MDKVKIVDVEIYKGDKVDVGVDKYIEYFRLKGKEVKHIYKDVFGRNSRVLRSSQSENSLTMSIKAAKKLLKKNDLKGSDIDLIVFSSQTPEFFIPATSIIIHNQLCAKPSTICFDINVNCTGMVMALDIVCKYISHNLNIKNALLIGCDLLNLIADPENELTYGQYGDVACCVLLEKTECDCGLLGCYSHTKSDYIDKITFPNRGLSNVINSFNVDDKFISWGHFDGTSSVKPSADNIRKILVENKLSLEDISTFCCSQVSIQNIQCMIEELKIDSSKIPYIADKYGYTATTSPFLVLYELLNLDKIKRGDYIIFWGVGAGWETNVVLFKY